MKLFLAILFVGVLAVNYHEANAQSSKQTVAVSPSGCSIPTPATLKRLRKLTEEQEEEYRSPIRYLIVYNEIGPTEDRRLEVFMNVANINEKNLRNVFCWIAERYPLPIAMTINVHTNLATIKTPDERELIDTSDNPRFSRYYDMYKRAHYHRYDSGREAFGYTTHLSPYQEKQVVIRDAR